MKLRKGDRISLLDKDGNPVKTYFGSQFDRTDVVATTPGIAGGFRVERHGGVYWLHDEGKTWVRVKGSTP
jgi:hypothetical protein